MADEVIKILHISDLHIEAERRGKEKPTKEFHDALRKYLVEEFQGAVQYIIASGDLGHQCHPSNVKYAQDWLKDLREGLGVRSEKMFIVAGNHDIEIDRLVDEHHDKRMDYLKGRSYIGIPDGYNPAAFDRFNQLCDEVGSHDSIVYADEKIQVVNLNSSWLAQEVTNYKKQQCKRLVEKALSAEECEDEMINIVLDEFRVACYAEIPREKIAEAHAACKDERELRCETIYHSSLRYSENIRQQLVLDDSDLQEIEKVLDDDRLNIVIFHHPDRCLHPFERYRLAGIPESGRYANVAAKGHVLICGHIHPPNGVDVERAANQLPILVGGGKVTLRTTILAHPLELALYSIVIISASNWAFGIVNETVITEMRFQARSQFRIQQKQIRFPCVKLAH